MKSDPKKMNGSQINSAGGLKDTKLKVDEYVVGMAVGVRHGPNFSVEDRLGEIVDKILYADGAFFNPEVFPQCVQQNEEKILMDGEKAPNTLRINNSNIVLDINFGKTFTAGNLAKILEKFQEQIIEGIIKEFKIRKIIRLGLMKKYLFKIPGLADNFVNRTIGNTLEGVNDINLRFSKKVPTEKAYVSQQTNDYKNTIFSIIKKSGNNEIFVSVDFQRYYVPVLASASQIEFPRFIREADHFNKETFSSWLGEFYPESSRG